MNVETATLQIKKYAERESAFERISSLLFYDGMRKVPPKGFKGRAKTSGQIAEEIYQLKTSNQLKELLDVLEIHLDDLDDFTKAIYRVFRRDYHFLTSIDAETYNRYENDVSQGMYIWNIAKTNCDYSLYAPYLKKLIDQNKIFAVNYGFKENPYNGLIDFYEEGMSTEILDGIFDYLKKELVPFIQKIVSKKVEKPTWWNQFVPRAAQKEFIEKMCLKMGLDPEASILEETPHGFTFDINIDDVRFTTNYHEHDFMISIYTAIHEAGHAINGLNIPHELSDSILGGGASAAFQESQSRFYENVLGRSEEFWTYFYDDFIESFSPYIGVVPLNEILLLVNYVELSYIRTNADELTYNLHILLRYEMERDFINKEYDVNLLPTIWNQKMKEFFNLDVENDRIGILQDIQWSAGRYGSFVSYVLGNLYNAQIMNTMQKEFNVFEKMKNGEFATIRDWLKNHVHLYSRLYTPNEQIEMITKEKLNPKYFVEYLKEKYTKLYNL